MPLDVSIYLLTDTVNIFVNLTQTLCDRRMIVTVLSACRLNQCDHYCERTRDESDDDRCAHRSQASWAALLL